MSQNTYFEHEGRFPTPRSDTNPALRFLANYVKRIDSADYNNSWLPHYHPQAVFRDATGIEYKTGPVIWQWIHGLFAPFSKIEMETTNSLVISRPDGTHTIYGEWRAHFWLKESGQEIVIPRSMVFTLGKAEGTGAVGVDEEVGFEGLQILDVRLYYDRTLLTPYIKRSAQEVEKFGA